MFSFFKKKKSAKSTDKVWRSMDEKARGLGLDVDAYLAANQNVFIFYYFEETKSWVENLLSEKGIDFKELDQANGSTKVTLVPASEIKASSRVVDALRRYSDPNTTQFLFANHYPHFYKETEILEELIHLHETVIECCFYVSLDDPLMEVFGSEKIKSILDRMGVKENEVIQHGMVTSSIARAQKKIDANVTNELRAKSQEEWFRVNLPSGL